MTKHLLTLGALALALVATSCKHTADKQTANTDSVATPDTQFVEEKVDTVRIIEHTEAQDIKKENKLETGTYYVIGGSFKELPRAQKFVKTLAAKGHQAQVLKPHEGFNRVAVKSATDEQAARTELAKLRKEFGEVAFWLLVP